MSTLCLQILLHEDPATKAKFREVKNTLTRPVDTIKKTQVNLFVALLTFEKEGAK